MSATLDKPIEPPRSVPSTTGTLIDQLLKQQSELTAVERFASWHEEQEEEMPSARYRSLLPVSRPDAGEQYAFEVDLDKCSGCKACVSACHSLNGLDEAEAWRDVGALISNDWRHSFQQTVTTACHHCVDPACLNGCPVLAYDKDAATGIVRHLDDQCIGCQYCVMMCPYDVPKYSARRGIVRKCDLCSQRLAVDEAPACAQACPNEAIRITVVNQKSVAARYRGSDKGSNSFLPASPNPALTVPTTQFKTARFLPPSLKAADAEALRPEPPHWPLVLMLVLTQAALGLFLWAWVLGGNRPFSSEPRVFQSLAWAGFAMLMAGLAASVLHLGRPAGAWRAFLGLRRSWLSREIVCFGAFKAAAALYVVTSQFATRLPSAVFWLTGAITVLAGALGVFCSAMVYHSTGRDYWRLPVSGSKFLCTALLLGAVGALFAVVCVETRVPRLASLLAVISAVVCLFKLAIDHRVLAHLGDDDNSPLNRTARLLNGELALHYRVRMACGWTGGICLPLLIALLGNTGNATVLRIAAGAAVMLCIAGEFLERNLFFQAVQPTRMPGGMRV